MKNTEVIKSIIAVGGARGFVVQGGPPFERRYVITAAHCFPRPPEGFAIGYTNERTYADLLGPLGGEQTVAAECVFVDPIADIAVLAAPDSQALWEEAPAAYDALVEDLPVLSVRLGEDASDDWDEYTRHRGEPPKEPAWLISLDGSPQQCTLTHTPNPCKLMKHQMPLRNHIISRRFKSASSLKIGAIYAA